jgi:hypothetical protein
VENREETVDSSLSMDAAFPMIYVMCRCVYIDDAACYLILEIADLDAAT